MACGIKCDDLWRGRGNLYVGDLTAGGLRALGNTNAFTISHTTETEEIEDFTISTGGNCSSVVSIDTISFSCDVFDWCGGNLRLALGGDLGEATASQEQTAEVVTVLTDTEDSFLATRYIMDLTGSITVTGPTGTPTYTLGSDYNITQGGAGIIVLASGTIPVGNIEITYDTRGSDVIMGANSTSVEVPLYFEGVNAAKDGRPLTIEIFRAQFNLTDELGLITEETATMNLAGEILSDPAKAGTTETLPGTSTVLTFSNFYRVEQALT